MWLVLEVFLDHLERKSALALTEATQGTTHWCNDVSRTQDIHPDTFTAPLHGQAAAQLNDSRLGAIVHARAQAFVRDERAH